MTYQPTIFEQPASEPLAARLRPRDLDEFFGQEHLLGKGKVLRRIIENDQVGSMIFWGPPGVGKTTLARIIARRTKAKFIDFSAVTSGIKEIKQVMNEAENARRFGEKTILFVDEIHRFNKAQQDAFLPYVEKGSIILIGATTENPSFEVNGALLSRCKVFVLQALKQEDLVNLLKHALSDERGFGGQSITIEESALELIAAFANGDARSALSTLEHLLVPRGFRKSGLSADAALAAAGGRAEKIELSPAFLAGAWSATNVAANPLYWGLQELIYADSELDAPIAWAAERAWRGRPEFDPAARPLILTGEACFPWMFEEMPELRPFSGAMECLMADTSFGRLYDPAVLLANETPLQAAVYFDDLYVDAGLQLDTLGRVGASHAWVTSEFEHDGLHGDRVFRHLLDEARDRGDLAGVL